MCKFGQYYMAAKWYEISIPVFKNSSKRKIL